MMRRCLAALCLVVACAGRQPKPATSGGAGASDVRRPEAYAFEEKLMFVQGPVGKLRVSDGGEGGGVPVVFVHGLGSTFHVWRAQLDHFRQTRRAVAYDQRAHGESDAPKNDDYRIESMAEDLHAVVRSLGIDRFFLVGHSMAGTVVSAYQGKHPDTLAGVVYVDAVGDMSGLPRDAVEKIEKREAAPGYDTNEMVQDYERMVGPKARPATRQAVLESASRFSPRAFAAIRRSMVRYDPKEDVERYRGPKLAVEVEGNDFPGMASKLPGVKKRTIPDVSHWLMLDDPGSLDKALDAFFAGS
jgi:pimeloyl-ACP methyl ester carboxylesterase